MSWINFQKVLAIIESILKILLKFIDALQGDSPEFENS